VPAAYSTTSGSAPGTAGVPGTGGSGTRGQVEVLEEHAAGGPDKSPKAEPNEARPAIRPPVPPAGNSAAGTDLSLLILFALLAIFGAFAVREAVVNQRQA
jgi:hypothetical protein